MVKMFRDYANNSMAFLRGNDLRQLLLYVQSVVLEYRSSLKLPSTVLFGLELEYENLSRGIVGEFVENSVSLWDSDYDGTVSTGGEVRSPILDDSDKTWKEVGLICDFLLKNKANTMKKAGGHIHVGSYTLGNDLEAWVTFLKLYTVYEHVLSRFFYGDKLNKRLTMEQYAYPSATSLYKVIEELQKKNHLDIEYFFRVLPSNRGSINFSNVDYENLDVLRDMDNTIEFRAPAATVYKVIEQNNVNVATKMLLAAKSKKINVDFLDYKLKKEFYPYSDKFKHLYDEICLKDALEFVDLVFERNIDKIYFLRQYLKDFSNNYGLDEVTKAKTFYKAV